MRAVVPDKPIENPDGTFLSPNWVQQTTQKTPTTGWDASMAYDPASEQMILFGGLNADTVDDINETWVWSNGAWTNPSPGTKPAARQGAMMAWDPDIGTNGEIVLFGGYEKSGSSYADGNDMWGWNGTNWSAITPAGARPTARVGGSMAWDPALGGLVLFGGEVYGSTTTLRNDTWLFKDNTWSTIQANGTSGAPAYRQVAGMAYSDSTDQLVLFGGTEAACPTCETTFGGDTWVLGTSNWTPVNVNPSKPSPSARTELSMTYDPGLGGIVLYGGISAGTDGALLTIDTDTWAWNGSRWLEADGIVSADYALNPMMAATSNGQVLFVDGDNTSDGSSKTETWLYDTSIPLLSVSIARGSGAGGAFYTGDAAKVSITTQNVGTLPITGASITSALTDELQAPGSPLTWSLSADPLQACQSGGSDPCGSVSGLAPAFSRLSLGAGGSSTDTAVAGFVATVIGSTRGCSVLQVPAVASNQWGGSTTATAPLTACGGGLGTEKWWTYDSTDIGSNGSASVNVADGNLVLKQSDTTPIQSHGGLAFELGRAYNSQDDMGASGPLGAGWQWDLSTAGGAASGLDVGRLIPPVIQSAGQSLLQPLAVTYVDRDGTRDVFRLKATSVRVGAASLTLGTGTLPFPLTSHDADGNTLSLCVDQTYAPPPGVDMYLFRYVQIVGTDCSGGSEGTTLGWSVVRPDRLRYDYTVQGALKDVVDPSGNEITYDYNGDGTLKAVYSDHCGPAGAPGTSGASCPQYSFRYEDPTPDYPNRRVIVTDPAGRITTYVVKPGAGTDPDELIQVWNPGDPFSTAATASPSITYAYSTTGDSCGPTVGGLCSVTDPAGNKTTFVYTAAPLGPDRVLSVTDRRANATGGPSSTKGEETRYSYHDATDGADGVVNGGFVDRVIADTATPAMFGPDGTGCAGKSTCERNLYQGIDLQGRVGEVDQGDATDDHYLHQKAFFWDGDAITTCEQPDGAVDNNLCETITRGVPSTAPFTVDGVGTSTSEGVTVSDQGVRYEYGDLGQVLSSTKVTDPSGGWPSGSPVGSSKEQVTTYGAHEQYVESTGATHVFDDRVLGAGKVESNSDAAEGTYSSAVKADHPVAYYKLDNLTGTNAEDTSGSTFGPQDATESSAVVLGVPGARPGDTAVGEPGAGVWMAHLGSLQGFAHGTGASSAFSVEAWQKTADTGTDYVVCSPCNGTGVAVGRYGGDPWVDLVAASGQSIDVVGQHPVADGQWHDVVYTYDGLGHASGVKIYVDGVLVPNLTYTDNLGSAPFRSEGDIVSFGYNTAAAGADQLDDVSLYPTVLPADPGNNRVLAHYQAVAKVSRVDDNTLYAITDRTQMLTPRGNAANSNWGDYLTTYRHDVPAANANPYPAPNQTADDMVCATGTKVGNTGLLCETDAPAASGVSAGACISPKTAGGGARGGGPTSGGYAYTCSRSEYGGTGSGSKKGQKTKSTSPLGATLTYTYYDDTGSCTDDPDDCDLSGTVSAGGWLKAVTAPDPTGQSPDGNSVVYAYDAAGNVARTWERNATQGHALSDGWTDASSPPSKSYSEVDRATPVTPGSWSVSYLDTEAVTPDGLVVGSGDNSGGQLGDGTTTNRSTPVTAGGGLHDVVQVAQASLGASSAVRWTAALTGDGSVYLWGLNNSTPAKQTGLPPIASISMGGAHVLALDRDGGLWAWGYNGQGQLGTGSVGSWSFTPVKVMTGVASMSAGGYHSLAIKTDGSLWVWGYNAYGQLGTGDTNSLTSPTKLSGFGDVEAVYAGATSSYAVKSDGTVWSWGDNTSGALGTGTTAANKTTPQQITSLGSGPGVSNSHGQVRQIVGAAYGAAALLKNGTVWAWGINNYGQLGAQSGNSNVPVQVRDADGQAVTGQVALAGGWSTYLSADAAGKATIWGYTAAGQLGDGTTPAQVSVKEDTPYDESPFAKPWRFATASRDAVGNRSLTVPDLDGNVVVSRPGRGMDVYSTDFDTLSSYDAGDELTQTLTPMERGSGDQGASQPTTYAYDAFGNQTSSVDPRGYATVYDYDSVNRLSDTKTTRGSPTDAGDTGCGPDGDPQTASGPPWTSAQQGHVICTTSTRYDGSDDPINTVDAVGATTRTTFDGASQKTAQSVPRSDSTSETTKWTHDADGDVLDTCPPREFDTGANGEPDASGTCDRAGPYSTHDYYDAAGNLTKTAKYRVDADGTSATEEDTTYGYDADGNQTSATDARGHTTTTTYDVLDRKTSQDVPRSPGVSEKTSWLYDPSGDVTAVEAPGSLNVGDGADGALVVDGTTASNSTDHQVHDSTHPYKVPDGARYTKVTLQNGGWITGDADHDAAHGLVFTATDTVSVCGACGITMAGRGQSGGAGASSGLGGQAGTDGDVSGGNGGGGGPANILGSGVGGGGGGHHGAGSSGLKSNGDAGADGGAASGSADFSDVGTSYLLASGGGGGGGGQALLAGTAGDGGDGGGFVHVTATTISINGTIDASGENGGAGANSTGAGGGGAGGGIWLGASSIDLSAAGDLNVTGGAGGTAASGANGGHGAAGLIRLDADSVTHAPADADRTRSGQVTAYSYDADNRVLDTVAGAQTLQADPDGDDGPDATPDPHGLFNLRTRAGYDADGNQVIALPAQAFSDTASLHHPKLSAAARMDFDLDDQPVAVYDPRYDTATTNLHDVSSGAGGDGGSGTDQQTHQCATSADPDAIPGYDSYPSTVGVCVTRTQYDADGNVTRSYLPTSAGGDNRYVGYAYTDDDLVATESTADPSANDGSGDRESKAAVYQYDGDGRQTSVTDPLGGSTTTSYTDDGLTAQSLTAGSGTVSHKTTYGYDADGEQTSVVAPDGYAAGADSADFTTTTTWTSDGYQAKIKAPGQGSGDFDVTTYAYDKVGNPTQVVSPSRNAGDGSYPAGLATANTFTFDNLLQSSAVPVDASHFRTTYYGYAPSGAKASSDVGACASSDPTACTPGSGVWTEGATLRYVYAPDGLNTDQIGRNPDGDSGQGKPDIATAYDSAGRVHTITTTGPTADVTITAGYYLDGLPRTVDDGTNANTYAFDGAGNVSVRTDTTGSSGVTGGATKVTSYAYNDAGLPSTMLSDVTGDATTWRYDQLGRPTGRSDATSSGSSGTVQRSVAQSYNIDDTLAATTVRAGELGLGTVVSKDEYAYDDNANITQDKISWGSGSSPTHTNDYTYNPANNLTGFTQDGASVAYGWDHDGNRISAGPPAGSSGPTTHWTYRADDSLLTENPATGATVDYHYSAAGELKSTTTGTGDDPPKCSTASYDGFLRTASQSQTPAGACPNTVTKATTTYTYDGLDRPQTTTTTPGGGDPTVTQSSYDGLSSTLVGQANALTGGSATPNVLYQLNPTGLPTAYQQTGTGASTTWLDTDGHGNVTSLLNNGDTSASCAVNYNPFGDPIAPAGGNNGVAGHATCATGHAASADTTGNVVWYRSQTRDATYGTYQLGTRTYDPTIAAFTTPDTTRLDTSADELSVGTDPLTANTYTYVNGNPLNLADPNGHGAVGNGPDPDPVPFCVTHKCNTQATAQAHADYQDVIRRELGNAYIYTTKEKLGLINDSGRDFLSGLGSFAKDSWQSVPSMLQTGAELFVPGYGALDGYAATRERIANSWEIVTHPKSTVTSIIQQCLENKAKCAGYVTGMAATALIGGEAADAARASDLSDLNLAGRLSSGTRHYVDNPHMAPAAANTGRVFASADAHVEDAANAIEAALPGRVVGVNGQRAMGGGLTREVDIDLGNLLVQVKSGNARGLTGQIARTQSTTGVPTIGYAPGISDAAWRNAASQGIPILRSPGELLAYIREFG